MFPISTINAEVGQARLRVKPGADSVVRVDPNILTNSPGKSRAGRSVWDDRSTTSHRRGDAVLAHVDAGGFDVAVRQFGAGRDEYLRAGLEVSLVAVDELHDYRV